MIVWIFLIGGVLVMLTLPARLFGLACGALVRVLVRDRKPEIRPPI